MNAKEYLQQVEKLDKVLQNKLQEKEVWKAIATSTTVSMGGERVQSSGASKSKMETAAILLMEIEEEISSCILSLTKTKKEVISTIEKLNAAEYDLLHKCYIGMLKEGTTEIEYLSLSDIAEMEGKSYTWATTTHGRALYNVQKLLDSRKAKK